MTRAEKLMDGIEDLGLHVEPNLDTSGDSEYVAIFCNRDGNFFGDDAPVFDLQDWTVVYACPIDCNRQDVKNALRRLIFDLYEVWPNEDNVTDADGQRYIYRFKAIEGIDYGDT